MLKRFILKCTEISASTWHKCFVDSHHNVAVMKGLLVSHVNENLPSFVCLMGYINTMRKVICNETVTLQGAFLIFNFPSLGCSD